MVVSSNPPAELDLIHVTAEHIAELRATAVEARVVISGERYFSGDAALAKAREVAQFVATVKAAGVDEADVRLEGAAIRTAKGLISKSSGADYTLGVHCRRLELLGDVTDALSSLKEARLEGLIWRYGDESTLQVEWLGIAAKNAHAKADRVAASLGVRVIGLHRFEETVGDLEVPTPFKGTAESVDLANIMQPVRRVAGVGMHISHTKWAGVRVRAQFRVSAMP